MPAARRAIGFLRLIKDHLTDAGLGHISEIFDGDPPHRPCGCIAQAWSVGEILRAYTEDVLQLRQATVARPNNLRQESALPAIANQ